MYLNQLKKMFRKYWRKLFFELYYYPERVRKYGRLWLWSKQALKERRKAKRASAYNKIPRRLRRVPNIQAKIERLAKRDGGKKCRYCGATENLTIDHVIPISVCKINEDRNWQILCLKCNTEKADKY